MHFYLLTKTLLVKQKQKIYICTLYTYIIDTYLCVTYRIHKSARLSKKNNFHNYKLKLFISKHLFIQINKILYSFLNVYFSVLN